MPGYIQAALNRFQHSPPTRKYHAQHNWGRSNCGATQKFSKANDTSQNRPPKHILRLHQITGTLSLYEKVINLTILVALETIAAAQTSGTTET